MSDKWQQNSARAVRCSRTRCPSEEFEPLIAVGEDGILYMSVGLVADEQNEPNMVDHPLMLLPVLRHGLCRPRPKIDAKGGARP